MPAIFDSPPHPPAPASFNMAAHVLAHADRLVEKPALVVIGGEEWTYGQLRAAVRGTATGLLDRGLTPGDRVLLRLGNTVDFPIAYLGALAAGLVPVPTSAGLTEAEITPMAALISPALTLQAGGIAAPTLDGVPTLSLAELRAMRGLPPAEWHMGDPERPGYIVFTSGTAATPRAVLHAHRAVWARQMMVRDWEAMGESDRVLHAGAFNWTYTMGTGLMDPWSVGATAIIPAEGTPAEHLSTHLSTYGATIFAAVPGVYRRLLRNRMNVIHSLRHGLSAGEKLPEETRTAWRETTGTDIYEAYGQSECSTFISGGPAAPAPHGILGRPQTGRRVAILAPDGTPVESGTPGALAVSSADPGLMLGYIGSEDEAHLGDWRLTGDTASMDEDGWISYLGRDDDVMTAGGYRVSPLEVEAVALRVPGVLEAAAFEREVKPGVRVIALAYRANGDLTRRIEDLCAEHLASYKRPRIVERRDALPKNPNGKMQRRVLREEHR